MKYKILMVDDETANLRLLERLFRADYQVFTAASGAEGLELLKLHDFALILSDQRMPGMTGIEFLKRAAALRSQTIRIILTGYTDVNVLVDVINSGVVYQYITKPSNNENLHQTVRRAVEHYESSKHQYELALQKERLEASLENSRRGFIKLVAGLLALKDSHSHAHAWRTTGYAVALGKSLRVEAAEIEEIALAAYLHEIENLAAGGEKKSGGIDDGFEMTARLLTATPHLTEIAAAVRYRHEYFDGGAPEKLCGEQIPLAARIIAVAEFYDSLTAPRFSNEAVSHDAAVEILQTEAGKRLDPSVVAKFAALAAVKRISDAVGAAQTLTTGEDVLPEDKMQTTAEILRRVKTEPLLAVKVLRAANAVVGTSPFVSLTAAVNSLSEAKLNRIGGGKAKPKSGEIERGRATQAVRCAVAAHLIAAHSGILDPDEAYTLGLLYNAGETLLAELFPEQISVADSPAETFGELYELETFGVDAVQVSRRLLESSGLPAHSAAALQPAVEWMRIDSPAADLLRTAFLTTRGDQSFENGGEVAILPKTLGTLNLSRAELDEILVRADFISHGISR